jgi:hypothetical protein
VHKVAMPMPAQVLFPTSQGMLRVPALDGIVSASRSREQGVTRCYSCGLEVVSVFVTTRGDVRCLSIAPQQTACAGGRMTPLEMLANPDRCRWGRGRRRQAVAWSGNARIASWPAPMVAPSRYVGPRWPRSCGAAWRARRSTATPAETHRQEVALLHRAIDADSLRGSP